MSLRSEVVRIFNELIAGSKKISQLPPANTLAGTELMEIVQNGENRKATASQFGGGSGATEFTQLTDVPATYVGAAGLAVTVNATEDGLEFTAGGGGGSVASVTGAGVDNTDPANPIISYPTPGDIGAEVAGAAAVVAGNLSAHISDAIDAHAGTAIGNTPAGTISATTVQAAINELDSEKASTAYADAKVADSITDGVTTIAPSQNAVFDALFLKANKLDTLNTQTGNYTLVLADAETKNVVMNVATSNTVTVPPNSSVAFPVGTIITVTQYGVGQSAMVAGGGVTLRPSAGVLTSPGQYSPMVIEKIGTDEWVVWNGVSQTPGQALTRVNDTNVTAVLSGTPASALLAAVEITLGWTGLLAVARGGIGVALGTAQQGIKVNSAGTALEYYSTSGTYTPTLTNVANVAASTSFLCTWMRVGMSVTVSGHVDIDPTTTLTSTQLGMSLPVASAFTTANQCGGVAAATAVEGLCAAIRSDATNDRAEIIYVPTDVSNHTLYFSFTYQVI